MQLFHVTSHYLTIRVSGDMVLSVYGHAVSGSL